MKASTFAALILLEAVGGVIGGFVIGGRVERGNASAAHTLDCAAMDATLSNNLSIAENDRTMYRMIPPDRRLPAYAEMVTATITANAAARASWAKACPVHGVLLVRPAS